MKYRVFHKTTYNYGEYVSICHSLACLKPKNLVYQNCIEFRLIIDPVQSDLVSREDFFGNTLTYFSIQSPHKTLKVISESLVEVLKRDFQHSLINHITYEQTLYRFQNNFELRSELLQYMLPSDFVIWDEEIKAFAFNSFDPKQPMYACVQALCRRIFTEFKFDPNHTTVNTPIKTILKEKRGVCQDFSHLAIACFRSMGLAARYVSGYLETMPPPGKPKLQGSDASHAWVSVYIPDLGWYDFDPTNNVSPSERHITVAWGRDYADITPLKGIVFSSNIQKLKVEVDVIPLNNIPREKSIQ